MTVKNEASAVGRKLEKLSLNARISGDVRDNIISGKWPPGFRIPFETDLAKTYECSRMTVNKVLTELARAGLLERTRKSGTYVKTPRTLSAAMEITNISKEVEDSGKVYSYKLLLDEVISRSKLDEGKLGSLSSEPVRKIECLHLANGIPFCFEERLVNIKSVPEIADMSFETESPGTWMLRTVPWGSAEHQISAALATPIIAERLAIDVGAPCLVVIRRTRNDEGFITWAKLWYSGENHRLIANFTPDG